MFHFFATEDVISKLFGPERKAILLGGFAGCWNFGDVLQLMGAIQWHAAHHYGAVVCPIVGLSNIHKRVDIDRLIQVFGIQDWIFHEYYQDDTAAPAQLSREGYTLYKIDGPLGGSRNTVHMYGGGFLNRFWGLWQLRLIEDALPQFQPHIYLVSGQQIDAEFAPAVAEYIKAFKPLLIGCRDQDSLAALSAHGVKAYYSGDDSWEALVQCADTVRQAHRRWAKWRKHSFGLHLNLSWYTHLDALDDPDRPSRQAAMLQELECAFALLQKRFGVDACPLVVCAYPDVRLELLDSLSSVEMSLFTLYFPNLIVADLVGMLLNNRLQLLGRMLNGVEIFMTTSYHTALFFKMLGIPTLLWAFNQYYQQKVRALGQNPMPVREFLALDLDEYKHQQMTFLREYRERREEWLRFLDQVLAASI